MGANEMTRHSFGSQPTIVIDMDETLLSHIIQFYAECPEYYQEDFPELPFEEWQQAGEFLYRIRPSAMKFLNECRQRGWKLVLLTSGCFHYQSQVLERLGLSPYFDRIFGRQHYLLGFAESMYQSHFDKPHVWVLVDDKPVFKASHKLRALGLDLPYIAESVDELEEPAELNFVQCAPFEGIADEQPLTDLIPVIESKLAAQQQNK